MLLAFLGAGDYENIPGFVYGILGGYFVFFNTFPVNMILQYKRWGKWADYRCVSYKAIRAIRVIRVIRVIRAIIHIKLMARYLSSL